MEIIEKQVEKVKEVPADNYGYNYGRRDINGKANAGLTLGIIGTAIIFWFKDVDCKSRNKVVSYFKEY